MHRFRTVLMIGAMAIGFGVFGLANPKGAAACSCVPPQPMAAYAADPNVVVLTGTVVAVDQNQQGTFRIERWYKGTSIAVDVPIQGGDGDACGIGLSVGTHVVMVAFIGDNVLHPSICSPWGDLSTPEGRELEDQAIRAFGAGTSPGRHAGELPGLQPGGPPDEVSVPWIVVVAGAGVAITLALFLASRMIARRHER